MKEYILEVRKTIPSQICQKIIKYFDHDLDEALVVSGLNKNIRNCLTTNLLEPKSFGQRIMSNYIQYIYHSLANKYFEFHKNFSYQRISQLDLLKYETNENKVGYKFHKDFGPGTTERHLSISLNLNDSFEGGEFLFDLGNDSYEQYIQGTGDAIIFPSNFMFSHQVNKITKGTRYAIIGWVI
jgi:Rps23 Pro-64 3,4-dihydroxylase Tpa1-like proline 4-hydroxylase